MIYFSERFNFCSKDCYEESFWKGRTEKDRAYFIKEYGWVADEIKVMISKNEAIKIYDYELKNSIIDFFDMIKKDFPKLYKYWEKRGISLLMLNVGLMIIGKIE